MTAHEIAQRLADPLWTVHGITPARVQKAQALAQRVRVPWAAVLAALPPEIRQQVEST